MKKSLSILMVLVWLPMAVHCQMENIPGLEFLSCLESHDAGEVPSDCADSGCCAAEHSPYKTGQGRLTLPAPNLLQLSTAPAPVLTDNCSDKPGLGMPADAPEELPQRWQFVFRTASPPRAPSFAS